MQQGASPPICARSTVQSPPLLAEVFRLARHARPGCARQPSTISAPSCRPEPRSASFDPVRPRRLLVEAEGAIELDEPAPGVGVDRQRATRPSPRRRAASASACACHQDEEAAEDHRPSARPASRRRRPTSRAPAAAARGPMRSAITLEGHHAEATFRHSGGRGASRLRDERDGLQARVATSTGVRAAEGERVRHHRAAGRRLACRALTAPRSIANAGSRGRRRSPSAAGAPARSARSAASSSDRAAAPSRCAVDRLGSS